MRSKVSDKARAYHEAAHTVVAIVMGIPVEKTTIQYTQESKTGREIPGHTKYKDITFSSKEDEVIAIFNSIIAAIAPVYIVDRLGEEGLAKDMASLGCVIDYGKAEAVVASIASSEEEKKTLMANANRKAEREVNRNWHHIQAVAEELLTKESLSHEELLEIMANATERGR